MCMVPYKKIDLLVFLWSPPECNFVYYRNTLFHCLCPESAKPASRWAIIFSLKGVLPRHTHNWQQPAFNSIGNPFRQASRGERRSPARQSLPVRSAARTRGRSREPSWSAGSALTRVKGIFASCWPSSRRNHRCCMVRNKYPCLLSQVSRCVRLLSFMLWGYPPPLFTTATF